LENINDNFTGEIYRGDLQGRFITHLKFVDILHPKNVPPLQFN